MVTGPCYQGDAIQDQCFAVQRRLHIEAVLWGIYTTPLAVMLAMRRSTLHSPPPQFGNLNTENFPPKRPSVHEKDAERRRFRYIVQR